VDLKEDRVVAGSEVSRRPNKPEGFRTDQSCGQTKAEGILKTCALAT